MTPTLQAIGWTLIHFCWQAAAIALLYRIASQALARAASNTRYTAALAALLLMLGASMATFAWEMRDALPAPAHGVAAATQALNNFSPTMTASAGPLLNPANGFAPPAARGFSLRTALPALPWPVLPWIDGMWLAGVLVLSLRSVGGWWLIQRLRASATIEAPEAVRACFTRIADALGLHRPVLLRVSSAIASPVTVGAFRALVLLPLTAAASLSREELEMVLAHELAHVRRADFLWNLVQTLVETLFFFHPAVWWIGGRIRHERELCCDDLALDVCPNPIAYASALFRLEVERSRLNPFGRLAMALDGHQPARTLRLRIARILGEPAQTANRGPMSLAAAAAVLVVLLLPVPQVLASLHPSQATAAPAAASALVHSAVASIRPAAAALVQRAAAPAPHAMLESAAMQTPQENPRPGNEGKGDYIDQMKAAGYDVDLDKLIAMKVQDITVEYARGMNQLGFGKLSADDLIACKVQDVTPEFIAKLKHDGLEVKSIQDAISYRIFEVTPEFVAGMKAAGFDGLTHEQLMALRVQDVTPEYAAEIRKQFPGATVEDVVKTKIFNMTPEFVAGMKAAGFNGLTHDQLMSLRVQDVTPEYAIAIRKQFPGATVEDVVKSKIFNIDATFIESAKRHGFTDLSFEKLVKLRISGILDTEGDK